jgi:hypothetical protein
VGRGNPVPSNDHRKQNRNERCQKIVTTSCLRRANLLATVLAAIVQLLFLIKNPPPQNLPDESIVFEKTDEIAPFYKHDIDTLFFQPIVVSTPPIDGLWCDYQRWHSHQSLLDQPPHNRTFVVGYYYCPNQAGNRLHDFMNFLIVAIVTNRTLLWKHYGKETCAVAHKGYHQQAPCE